MGQERTEKAAGAGLVIAALALFAMTLFLGLSIGISWSARHRIRASLDRFPFNRSSVPDLPDEENAAWYLFQTTKLRKVPHEQGVWCPLEQIVERVLADGREEGARLEQARVILGDNSEVFDLLARTVSCRGAAPLAGQTLSIFMVRDDHWLLRLRSAVHQCDGRLDESARDLADSLLVADLGYLQIGTLGWGPDWTREVIPLLDELLETGTLSEGTLEYVADRLARVSPPDFELSELRGYLHGCNEFFEAYFGMAAWPYQRLKHADHLGRIVRAIELASLPFCEAESGWKVLSEEAPDSSWKLLDLKWLDWAKTIALHRATLDLACLRFRIELYRAIHGAWPDDLSTIGDPSQTERIDPFSGRPYLYSMDASGYRLESAGADRLSDEAHVLRYASKQALR